ncbi:hypothetical protein ABT052_28865 [Streptomyces sp. NPDC002766]|uniref:hypothetical protein n=1 Tax=Streptomyces sp. NPDC002766 TaxID=3154429 RepID=UPI00332982D2
MSDKRLDGGAGGKEAGRELTEEEKAFAKALKTEFLSTYGPQKMRAFADRVGSIDHGTVSRYLSGKILASEWFLDLFEQDASTQGRHPIAPTTMQELRRLRSAALRSSKSSNYRLQAMVEDLEAAVRELRVQRCLDREQIDVQQHLRAVVLDEHRELLACFEQLQRNLSAVRDELRLAHDAREEAEAGREQAQQNHAALLRQLEAASAYAKDLHTQLADQEHRSEYMAQLNRSLQREVSILRRQVNALQQEQQTERQHAEQPVKAGAIPATATVPDRTPVTKTAVHGTRATPAPPSSSELPSSSGAGEGAQESARKGNEFVWFVAAMSSLAAAFGSFFWGMSRIGPGHGWPASGVAGVITGLATLLTLVPFTFGRLMRAQDSAGPGDATESGESTDDSYGYYPMM